jgi:spore coat polysaccharide biosynthesis protein SpsF (cytidylyltransferase family)
MKKITHQTLKTLCIIQARMGATRLPGKVLMEAGGVPLLEYEIRRVKQAGRIDSIVVATTIQKEDDAVEALCKRLGVDCCRGPGDDVLERFRQCAAGYPDYSAIVRITGDCPLIDPSVIDEVIDLFESEELDYASNVLEETFPDGMDVEVFTREALFKAAEKATLVSEREHVTPYIRAQSHFKKGNVVAPHDFSHIRLTVDEPADFEVISFLIEHSPKDAGYLDHIALLTKHPDLMLKNTHIKRNEGWEKSLKNDTEVRP